MAFLWLILIYMVVTNYLLNGRSSKYGLFQEISDRTHFSRTPKKPEYLIALSKLTEGGPLGFGPIQFLMAIGKFQTRDDSKN